MQLKEILETEGNRTEDSKSVIHLYKEGSFYRAYEWSAWLCHRYINQFKVTHRKFKTIEQSVLFIGFPITSLQKYVTNVKAYVHDIDGNNIDICLSDEILLGDMSHDIMSVDYTTWKDSIPIVEQVPKQKENKEIQISTSAISANPNLGIIQQILAFPLENRTPIQCMTFIAELKQQVLSII